MKALLELIKKLYGSKALSKTIGTRTNVITLPDKDTKRFVSNELNIDAASDAAVKKAYEDVEKLIPDIPKMNDQEILTFTGNLRRLDQRLNPPSAEVIEFGTKQPVSPTGIKQLAAESGQMSPPGTLMGDLESRINQLRASGKSLEDITKGKGMSFEDLIKDPTRSGGPLDPKVGIVRTAAREILEKNLKAGKIDIPDEAARDAILKSSQGGVDPIDVLRKTYGEGVLEQLDDIADELNRAKDYKDIQKILQKEKLFDATPKKTYGYDEGVYSDEEMAKILSEASEEPKVISADSDEGKKITEALIGKPKAKVTELVTAEKIIADMNKMDPMDAMYEANKVLKKEGKYKDLSGDDVDRIMKETEDNIFQRNIPEEPEEFATGGRVGLKEGSGILSNLIKENIPAEYRLYAKSILPGGKKGNVDESYFTEDFKRDLRQQALTKFKETGKLKGSIGELDTHYRSGAKKYGQGETYPINKLIGLPSTYAALGSYNYEIDPETLDVKIKDTYDWNPAYGKDSFSGKIGYIGDKKGKDVDTSMLKDYVMQSLKTGVIDKGDALELLGNYLGPKASKGEGINVDIDIPTQDIPMEEGETFATGGRVGFKEGTPEMDPKKLKQVQQMIKMGADVSTISSITGLSEAQINQIQKSQVKRPMNASGGVAYLMGL